jgi:hypothetical protein
MTPLVLMIVALTTVQLQANRIKKCLQKAIRFQEALFYFLIILSFILKFLKHHPI